MCVYTHIVKQKRVQAIMQIKKPLFVQKHCNLGDTDPCSKANCILKRTKTGRIYEAKKCKV